MLTKKEKEKNFESFINSKSFGKAAFVTLFLFTENAINVRNTIQLYDVIIAKLERGEIKHVATNEQLLRMKQQIILDMHSRLLTIMESFFALCSALTKDYSKIPSIMTYYDTKLIRSFIKRVREKRLPIWKMAGFPRLRYLRGTSEETLLLQKLFDSTCDTIAEILGNLVNFYDSFRILHGKNKHGLTMIGGTDESKIDFDLFKSHVMALDRKPESEMPRNYIRSTVKEIEVQSKWFNVVSVMRITRELAKKSSETADDLMKLITYVTDNHMLFGENCGQDYLPIQRINEKEVTLLFYPTFKLSEQESAILNDIGTKFIPNMNIPNRQVRFRHEIKDDKQIQYVQQNLVSNIWIKPS